MAVVQISRIQIRRGKKDGPKQDDPETGWTGVKLASAEMAWCIDSQQLYIGNGETSEGAPRVGNTEILTAKSNLFDIASKYGYGRVHTDVRRTLQQRLDERVNAESFGVVPVISGDSSISTITDQTIRTEAIQDAINRLYLDSVQNEGNPNIRAVLEFGPGIYEFNSPIYIHSFTHIVGAGPKRTIFKYTGTGSAFILTNDDTYMDDSSVPDSTDLNQCRSVILKNFSIQLDSNNTNALLLDSVKDSEFTNIELSSSWHEEIVSYENSKAIDMLATNDLITCSNNLFNNLRIFNFRIGINAQGDINSNTIQNCTFSTKDNTNSLEVGINFGKDINISLLGQKYGPRNNVITDCVFNRIGKQGIKIYNGTGNVSSQNRFTMVGDQYGGNDEAKYGNIEFDVDGNMTSQDLSDRHQLSAPGTTSYATPYISEVIGKSNYSNFFTNTINLQYITTPVKLFRLPVSRPCHLEVEYLYQSTNQRRLRRGKLSIVVNTNDLDTGGLPKLEMIDDYDYFGLGMSEQFTYEDIHLIFSASIRKYTVELVNSYTLELRYKYDGENTQSLGDQAKLTYTYKILS
jgi:hypothetical protein